MNTLFDGVFVINLDFRTDRLHDMIVQLSQFNLPFERFSAIQDSPGTVGCGKSHIACLKLAKQRGYKSVLILEDDFQFLVPPDVFFLRMRQFIDTVPFDVCMLSYNDKNLVGRQELEEWVRVQAAQDAAGYIVHESFYDPLIACLEQGLALLQATGHHWLYSNDQVWKTIQPSSRWYAAAPRIGNQRDSASNCADTWLYEVS
jgi:hypothetical protein